MAMNCDYCSNYIYDEEDDCYYCDVNLDERTHITDWCITIIRTAHITDQMTIIRLCVTKCRRGRMSRKNVKGEDRDERFGKAI